MRTAWTKWSSVAWRTHIRPAPPGPATDPGEQGHQDDGGETGAARLSVVRPEPMDVLLKAYLDAEAEFAAMIDRHGSLGRAMSLRQLMDRMLEDAFVMPREGGSGGGESWGGPSMDVYEEGDYLVVEAQLPGMKPDDIAELPNR